MVLLIYSLFVQDSMCIFKKAYYNQHNNYPYWECCNNRYRLQTVHRFFTENQRYGKQYKYNCPKCFYALIRFCICFDFLIRIHRDHHCKGIKRGCIKCNHFRYGYVSFHLLCQAVVFQYNEWRFGENPEEKPYIFLNRYHSQHYRRMHFYKIWIFYILSSSIDVPAPGILRMYSSPSQENKKDWFVIPFLLQICYLSLFSANS